LALLSHVENAEPENRPVRDGRIALSVKVDRALVQEFRRDAAVNERSLAGHLRWVMRAYLNGDLQ
jgi:hypothetical protein